MIIIIWNIFSLYGDLMCPLATYDNVAVAGRAVFIRTRLQKISKNARHFVCLVFIFLSLGFQQVLFHVCTTSRPSCVCLHSLESKTSNNAKLLCFRRDGRVFHTSQNFPTDFSRPPPRALGPIERRIINISWSFRQRNKGKTRWLIKD